MFKPRSDGRQLIFSLEDLESHPTYSILLCLCFSLFHRVQTNKQFAQAKLCHYLFATAEQTPNTQRSCRFFVSDLLWFQWKKKLKSDRKKLPWTPFKKLRLRVKYSTVSPSLRRIVKSDSVWFEKCFVKTFIMTVLSTWDEFQKAAERLYLQDPSKVRNAVSKQCLFFSLTFIF